MSETRAAAAIQRAEAGGASRAAWGAFWAADAKSSVMRRAARDEAEALTARLLKVALDAERVAVESGTRCCESSGLGKGGD